VAGFNERTIFCEEFSGIPRTIVLPTFNPKNENSARGIEGKHLEETLENVCVPREIVLFQGNSGKTENFCSMHLPPGVIGNCKRNFF